MHVGDWAAAEADANGDRGAVVQLLLPDPFQLLLPVCVLEADAIGEQQLSARAQRAVQRQITHVGERVAERAKAATLANYLFIEPNSIYGEMLVHYNHP